MLRASLAAVLSLSAMSAMSASPAPKASKTARPTPATHPATSDARCEVGTPKLKWPTPGALVNRFGAPIKSMRNNGIDLAAFTGMAVRAAAPGKVVFAGKEPERFGQLIVIDHGSGWATAYAYLGKVSVREGQRVTSQTVIARIGASGEVKKPTLHFELRRGTTPRDPVPCLPARL